MQGGVAEHIEGIDTEEKCAVHVRENYEQASAATWDSNNQCWAEFGEHMVHSSSHQTCRFQGNRFCVIPNSQSFFL